MVAGLWASRGDRHAASFHPLVDGPVHGGPLQPHRSTVEIRLADGQLTETTVAHELAHALAGVDRGHDERFRAAHVDVTALLCGAAARTLAATYRSFGLAVGDRAWPAPWRADGDTFRIVV